MNSPLRNKLRKISIITIMAIPIVWYILILPRPLFDTPYSTVLYARNGELLGAKVAEDGQWRFPPNHTLPSKYIDAVLRYEDRTFYEHIGFSPTAIVRAARQNFRAGRVVSGGSTITMQLVRLSRNNPPRTITEKTWEILLATRLEWSYTKDETLALYAAHAPFGGNVVGIEAAAWRYFGHDPAHLSWAEAATLAVLPNSPSLIHPGKGREILLRKRNRLLENLLLTESIDSVEYISALIEPLPDAPKSLPRQAPHLLERMPKGTTTRSSLDHSLQQRTQQIVDNYGRWVLAANRIRNAAVLVADVQTGEVLAYVGNISSWGSPTEPQDGRSVDIIRSRRSTGSLLKPILYGALLNEGQILPNTLIFDTPLNIAGFTPSNYNKTFSGVVSARAAVERSLNVPIVRMLTLYNNSRFLGLLRSMGLTTLDRSADNYGATLILGGSEGTLWEMSSLYASLARSLETHNRTGAYALGDMRPLSVLANGSDKRDESTDQILSPLSASSLWFMFRAMSGVNRPEEESSWQVFSSMKQVAWKTGTSYGNRDAWAIGLTPRHLVGVWVGNADGEGRASMTGVGHAAPIMFDIFSMLPSADEWFGEPLDDMELMEVCRRSGHNASEWCHSSDDPVDTLSMPLAGITSALCPYHKPITTNGTTSTKVTKGWFVLPPAAEYYYRQSVSDYAVPPDVTTSRPLELIYPQHNATLYLPQGFTSERFVFRAAHRSDSSSIHWHLNDRYLESTRSASAAGHTITVSPTSGVHWLTIVDNAGNRQRIRFRVLTSNQ